jgi:hypothetical protein
MMKEELFFELIQIAVGRRERLSRKPSAEEWAEIYAMSKKQAVVGVAFLALEQLCKEGQKPPVALLYEWDQGTLDPLSPLAGCLPVQSYS